MEEYCHPMRSLNQWALVAHEALKSSKLNAEQQSYLVQWITMLTDSFLKLSGEQSNLMQPDRKAQESQESQEAPEPRRPPKPQPRLRRVKSNPDTKSVYTPRTRSTSPRRIRPWPSPRRSSHTNPCRRTC